MGLRRWMCAFSLNLLVCYAGYAHPSYLFRITFADKKGAPSLENARDFLSDRSLERRNKQGILLNYTDVPVSPEYLEQVRMLTGGKIRSVSKWLNSCVLSLDDSLKIQQLQKAPFVTSFLCVGYGQTGDGITRQTAPKLKTTGNPSYYGSTWTQTDLVNGDCLHDKGRKGQGMRIAVLDDGFHYVNTQIAFDSIFLNGRIVDTRNFVLGNTDVYSNTLTHGTEVLSTIAGYLPNTYVGAAPLAEFALYVTEDAAHEWPVEMDNLVAAFERADSAGVDIISTSTGYNSFDPPFQAQSITNAQMDGKTTIAAIGANIAASKGILMVITAGNEGNGGLLTPGDADSALTVGNVDASKAPAGTSGYGPNAAGHIKPEVCALGSPGSVITTGTTPFSASGTSISTPQIAGFAACLWQGSAGKTNTQIKRAIIQSAHLYPNPQMPQLGYGVPDFCAADVILDIAGPSAAAAQISVYPNPARASFTISLTVFIKQTAVISLCDVTGNTVLTKEVTLNPGTTSVPVTLPGGIAAGLYMYKIMMDGNLLTGKIVLQ